METSNIEDNSNLWKLVSDSFKKLHRNAEKNLSKKTGLSIAEYRILNILSSECCSMSRLSTEVTLTQAAITGLIDRLEAQGFVARARGSEDRRVVTIKITPKGEQVFEKAKQVHADFVDRSLGSLDPEELSELSTILKKLAGVTDALTA